MLDYFIAVMFGMANGMLALMLGCAVAKKVEDEEQPEVVE